MMDEPLAIRCKPLSMKYKLNNKQEVLNTWLLYTLHIYL